MFEKFRNNEIPSDVKTASKLIITYAVVVILGALWNGFINEFSDLRGFLRAIVRFVGMAYIGWWLLSLNKKAWWFAIVSSSIFLVFGIIAIGALLYIGIQHDSGYLRIIMNVIFPVYLLGHTILILSKPSTRSAFY